ncbi:hypothetical protein F4805DRAFT_458369 [Annulohypoxylon moriforme]|nr:hypothetical protein F4805DRAFT_458369 [Annulohypoxylon moriforme]
MVEGLMGAVYMAPDVVFVTPPTRGYVVGRGASAKSPKPRAFILTACCCLNCLRPPASQWLRDITPHDHNKNGIPLFTSNIHFQGSTTLPLMSSLDEPPERSNRSNQYTESGEQSSKKNKLLPFNSKQINDLACISAGPSSLSVFFEIVQSLVHCNIPSIQINNPGIPSIPDKLPIHGIFSLGSGLTSDVIRHITNSKTDRIVPSGSIVALKTFKSRSHDNACDSKAARGEKCEVYQTILREIRAFCHPSLRSHPNIVQLLFIGWQKESCFPTLAMELGEHGSLDFIIREANPGPTLIQKRHITLDIALGLRAVHRAGYIHGDLKPHNVLIMGHSDPRRQLVAKLIDFGGSSHDKPAHFTPLWSAPEVVNDDYDVDWKKADVYSFGLITASLWAKDDCEHRVTPLSSCMLSWFTQYYPDDPLIESTLFACKSSNSWCVPLFDFLLDAHKTGVEGSDRFELLHILSQILHPHFWQRPDTEDLVQLLSSFGERVGRDIEREDNITESWSTLQRLDGLTDRKTSESVEVSIELMEEFIFEQYSTTLKDAGSPLVGATRKEIFDIPAHVVDIQSCDQFIEFLRTTTLHLLAPVTPLGYPSIVDFLKNRPLREFSWLLAELHLPWEGKRRDLERASEWMRISTLCGSRKAMHFAALSDMGTLSRVPVRLCLSLLALSHSELALQRLSTDWPDHFKIVRQIIQTKRIGSKTLGKWSEESFPFCVLLACYESLPSEESRITTRLALELRSITEITEILDGKIVTPDLDEILPGLLHELSHLVDTEAGPLAEAALKRGASLDNLLPCKSPILNCEPLEPIFGPPPASYSPLSFAIIYGKTMLAIAIFYLHVVTETPIPDFPTALSLSFRYLQHEVGEWLLSLLRENPSMCHDGARSWEANEALLYNLLIVTMSRDGPTESVRRAMHGSAFDSKYEECLQILLREGVDPTQGVGDSCPFFNALKWDDVIGLKPFIQYLQQYRSNRAILDYIRDPGHVWTEDQRMLPQILVMCIKYNSHRCLDLLLKTFPHMAFEELGMQDYTLLHFACHISSSLEVIHLLIDIGIGVTTSEPSYGCFNPLLAALLEGYLPAADLIASRYPDDLVRLISQSPNGYSVFCILLMEWTEHGNTGLINSFRWLANHDGIHFYGPNDLPIWEKIFRRPRPTRRLDQLREAELLSFLLSLDMFRSNINEPNIVGFTLLQVVALFGHVEAVKVLLDHGADRNIRSTISGCEELSAVDFAYLRFGSSYPEIIKAAGSLEMEQWRNDINFTITLLQKDASPATGTRLLVQSMVPLVREHLIPQRLPLNARIARYPHGDWPRPILPSTGGNPMQQPLQTEDNWDGATVGTAINHILDGLYSISPDDDQVEAGKQPFSKFEEELRAKFLREHTPKGPTLTELLRPLREAQKSKEGDRRDTEFCIRELWRLPPDWKLLRIRGAIEVIYFLDLKAKRIAHEKPVLYCGERDETIAYDRKGKGRVVDVLRHDTGCQYVDLTISTRTASDITNAKLSLSCGITFIGPYLTCKKADLDDSLATIVNASFMGEILHATIISDNAENLAALIGVIDDIEQTDWEGLTPLQQAVVHRKSFMANIIIARGGQVDRMYPEDGLLPLHVSIRERDSSMLGLLLENNADPNGKTRDGIPPLHFCLSQHDAPEIVRALAQNGANVCMAAQNTTPLELARSYKRKESLRVLREAVRYDGTEDIDISDSDTEDANIGDAGTDNSHDDLPSHGLAQTSETPMAFDDLESISSKDGSEN